jgi:hypothetical protein
MSTRHASCLILEWAPAVNLDDLSNTYSGSFHAANAKDWHTTSADLRVKDLPAGVIPRKMWISAGGAVFLGVYEWAVHGLMST